MRIIDVHAHIYPTSIATKAVANIGKFYQLDMSGKSGTAAELKEMAAEFDVHKIVVHSVATSPHQVQHINDFMAAQISDAKLVPFATLNPDMSESEIEQEIERIKTLGLSGIKLHPDCQNFSISGERGHKLFNLFDGTLPVLVHAGDRRFGNSNPWQIVQMAKEYPHIKIIAAHFGGYSEWEYAEDYKGLDNVFFDTSSSLYFLSDKRALEIMDNLGYDRFMFGTDYPMWNYRGELQRVLDLGLDAEKLDMVLYSNAVRILKIADC